MADEVLTNKKIAGLLKLVETTAYPWPSEASFRPPRSAADGKSGGSTFRHGSKPRSNLPPPRRMQRSGPRGSQSKAAGRSQRETR